MASASPLIDFDFEDGQTTGWSINGGSDPYLSVVSDPLRADNLVMKVDDSFKTLNGIVTSFAAQDSGVFKLTLQMMVSASGGAAVSPQYFLDRRIVFTNSAVSQFSTYSRLWYYGNSPDQFRSYGYNGNGNGTGTGERGPNAVLDHWLEITQTFDIDNRTWSWTIQDLTAGGDVWNSGEMGFWHNPASLARLTLWRVDNAGGVFYLDNVKLESIPEPGTMALVGMAGLGWLAVRRRRSHHA